jgi:glycosyltransferase involved in cell wall biosynthesis
MNFVQHRPLVSVILTVFNREKSIKRSIDSLIGQSYSNWELIVIDDGSSDNSFNILKGYEKYFTNIRTYQQDNRKLAFSRNRGIFLSEGEFITFLDSDDEYEEEHLSLRIRYLLTNPDIDLIHGGVKIIGSKFVRDKDNPYSFIHLSECTIGATLFGKRNVFKTMHGFKENLYSEDSEFLKRASMNYRTREVNFNTYIYHREEKDSITHNYVPEKISLL